MDNLDSHILEESKLKDEFCLEVEEEVFRKYEKSL